MVGPTRNERTQRRADTLITGATQNVLEPSRPRFQPDQASAIALELFGVSGHADELRSERDQVFLIDDGGRGAVLKISNCAEDPAILDLQNAAVLHIAAVDPDLPIARPRVAVRDGTAGSPS